MSRDRGRSSLLELCGELLPKLANRRLPKRRREALIHRLDQKIRGTVAGPRPIICLLSEIEAAARVPAKQADDAAVADPLVRSLTDQMALSDVRALDRHWLARAIQLWSNQKPGRQPISKYVALSKAIDRTSFKMSGPSIRAAWEKWKREEDDEYDLSSLDLHW